METSDASAVADQRVRDVAQTGPDAGGSDQPLSLHGDDARTPRSAHSPSTSRARCPGPSTTGADRRRSRSAPPSSSAPRDRTCILHRDLGAHFVRGVTPDRYLANYMGRSGGVTGGKEGNMHFGDRRARLRRDGLDAPRHGPGRERHGPRIQAARRAPRGDDLLRRGLDRQRAVARGDELRRHPSAAGRLHPREQPLRVLDSRTSSSSRSTRSSGPRRYGFPRRQRRRQRRRGGVRGRRASRPSAPAAAMARR